MRGAGTARRRGRGAGIVAGLLVALVSGCGTLGDLLTTQRVQQELADYGFVAGTVSEEAAGGGHWLVVLIATLPCDAEWEQLLALAASGRYGADARRWPAEVRERAQQLAARSTVAQHVVVQGAGRWYAALAPGCYGVAAFSDRNRNYRYDDEPAAHPGTDLGRLFELRAGEERTGLDIVIPEQGRLARDGLLARSVEATRLRSHSEQQIRSVDEVLVEGEIADARDPRFSEDNAHLGYYDILEFAWRYRPGIYFAEAYDPAKVPVLFVHGAVGSPLDFAALVDRMDRERFQPWFFFYPSGASLSGISDMLAQSLLRLRLRHGFDRLAVVAHSMGGLVARSFALKYAELDREHPLRVLVTVSTPWGGLVSARMATEQSPIVVASWNDVAEGSAFIEALFHRSGPSGDELVRLSEPLHYAALFGLEDETVPPASAVRWEAMRDADERWPLLFGHVEILERPETAELLGEILSRAVGP